MPQLKNRVVYLLHFDKKLGRVQHYMGITYERRVATRMREHQLGNASNVSARFIQARIGFSLAALIGAADFEREQRLKAAGHYSRLCIICRAAMRQQQELIDCVHFDPLPLELVCTDLSSSAQSYSSASRPGRRRWRSASSTDQTNNSPPS